MGPKTRIYLDTSVINFLFADDSPFLQIKTIQFFEEYIRTKFYDAYISDVVLQEIHQTQNESKRYRLLNAINENELTAVEIPDFTEVNNLADLYQEAGIIPIKKRADALHIAIAVIYRFDFLVSWNFQHLANANRERRVLVINYQQNYLHPLRIISPLHLMDAKD